MPRTYRVEYTHPLTQQRVVVGQGLTYEQAEQAWQQCLAMGADAKGNPKVNPDILLDSLAPPPRNIPQ